MPVAATRFLRRVPGSMTDAEHPRMVMKRRCEDARVRRASVCVLWCVPETVEGPSCPAATELRSKIVCVHHATQHVARLVPVELEGRVWPLGGGATRREDTHAAPLRVLRLVPWPGVDVEKPLEAVERRREDAHVRHALSSVLRRVPLVVEDPLLSEAAEHRSEVARVH